MAKFPFISTAQAIVALRIVTALIFVTHAVVRVVGLTIDRFGEFLESKGFVFGILIVWIITVYEIGAGLLLALGIFTRWLALGFIILIALGIIIIHAANGWFVGEHGTGGMEYSILLIASLFLIATTGRK